MSGHKIGRDSREMVTVLRKVAEAYEASNAALYRLLRDAADTIVRLDPIGANVPGPRIIIRAVANPLSKTGHEWRAYNELGTALNIMGSSANFAKNWVLDVYPNAEVTVEPF